MKNAYKIVLGGPEVIIRKT